MAPASLVKQVTLQGSTHGEQLGIDSVGPADRPLDGGPVGSSRSQAPKPAVSQRELPGQRLG